MNAKDKYLAPLTEEIYYSLRRTADEAAEAARVVCEFEDLRAQIKGRWVDVNVVTLVNLGVYVIRRVRFKDFKCGKIVSAEKPVVARWSANGWQNVVGYWQSTTASFDGIQVLV